MIFFLKCLFEGDNISTFDSTNGVTLKTNYFSSNGGLFSQFHL